jgi:hypothetical protein
MAMEVARLAKKGKLLWSAPLPTTEAEKRAIGDKLVFAADGVHPYPETGHELYLQAIIRSLDRISLRSSAPGKRRLPAPLDAANYEKARMIPLDKAKLSSGFIRLDPATAFARNGFIRFIQQFIRLDPATAIAQNFATHTGGLYRCAKAGETITFQFKGTYAAIYDIIGPDCGQVIVTLDNRQPQIVPRFDSFSTYPRLATLFIGADLPDTVHTVRIEIHPDQPDKVKILAQRNKKMDDPKRYNDRAFYPGAILIVGDMNRL